MGSEGDTPSTWLGRRFHAAVSRTGTVALIAGAVATYAAFLSWRLPAILPPRLGTGLVVGIIAWVAGMMLASFGGPPPRRRPWQDRTFTSRSPVTEPFQSVPAPTEPLRRPVDRSRSARSVRTPRGARRYGADEAIRLKGPRDSCAERLAQWLIDEAGDHPLTVGLAGIDEHRACQGWGVAVAEALAKEGQRVLLIDLVTASELQRPGVAESARRQVPLAHAVEYHRDLRVARLGPGGDRRLAAVELADLLETAPRGVDAVIVALPPLGHEVVSIVGDALGRLVLLAVEGVTSIEALKLARRRISPTVEVTAALVGSARADEDVPVWRGRGFDETVRNGYGPNQWDGAPDQLDFAALTRAEVWRRELEDADLPPHREALDPDRIWVHDAERRGDGAPIRTNGHGRDDLLPTAANVWKDEDRGRPPSDWTGEQGE